MTQWVVRLQAVACIAGVVGWLVVVAAVGLGVCMVVGTSPFEKRPWHRQRITQVAVSPDRRTVFAIDGIDHTATRSAFASEDPERERR